MACFVFGYRILSLNLTSQKNFQDIKVIKYMEIIITLLRFIPYVIFLQDKKEESPVWSGTLNDKNCVVHHTLNLVFEIFST